MFLFKRKKIIVDCFTDRSEVYNHAQISPSKEFIPQWWRDLPKSALANKEDMRAQLTMKACAGFIDFFQNTYSLPLWSDIRIKVSPVGFNETSWQWADFTSRSEVHPADQSGKLYDPNFFQHIKLGSPWTLKCKTDLKFLYHMPTWNMNEFLSDVIILPGVLEFKYQNSTHVQALFVRDKTEEKVIDLPFGMPIANLTPMTEKDVEFKSHLVTKQELERIEIQTNPIKFSAKYYAGKKVLKSKEKTVKCPFGFRKGN